MTDIDEGGARVPRVAVLMATFNGRRFIDEQIDSVLTQDGVDLTLYISDDGSSDGTVEYVRQRAQGDARIRLLPKRQGAPGVTANFLHLLMAVPASPEQFIAFCDQDDIWVPGKLKRQIALAQEGPFDAVSSNVTSFSATGERHVIVKNQPQRRWDHIFEAAGPGSTYLLTSQTHVALVAAISELDTTEIGVHDWLIYALTRALDLRWHIDGEPQVDYRQHEANVIGEHLGVRAMCSRIRNLRSGFYREQFILVARAVRTIGARHHSEDWLNDLDRLITQLEHLSIWSRWGIWRRRAQIRRDPRQGRQLALACLLHLW